MKKAILKLIDIASTMFSLMVITITAYAINTISADAVNQPEAFTIEQLTIIPDQAILEGETKQMQVEEFDEFTWLNFVEWSSSNPDVISCTKDGEIKGRKKGMATITVKAKFGGAKDSINVYCAKRITEEKVKLNYYFVYTSQTPSILSFKHLYFSMPISSNFLPRKSVTVKGKYNNFFYVIYTHGETEFDGFVSKFFLPSDVGSKDSFKQLSAYTLNVFTGKECDTKVTTNYTGEVVWSVSPKGIINFNAEKGTVSGVKPGIATISATAEGVTRTCTVYSIYEWPLQWTGMANKNTYLYTGNKSSYTRSVYKSAGSLFTVCGDVGDGWAYGFDENNSQGFVMIADFSTKNTIGFYNSLGWGYPLQNKEYNYINSPYAPRPSLSDEHRGFDINEKNNQPDIEGQAIAAAFDGVVKKVGADLNKKNGCGYYICISSNTVDPVTGKNLIAIYQHMKSFALFSDTDEVKKRGDYRICWQHWKIRGFASAL